MMATLPPLAETNPGRSTPLGLSALRYLGVKFTFQRFQLLVWVLTFISYTLYHASRKPLSIVKGVLHPVPPPLPDNTTLLSPPTALVPSSGGWAPFGGKIGRSLLGELDLAFLACYSFGMYFAGQLADRMDLRIFLTVGMLGSGLFACLWGMGYFLSIHSLSYFLLLHMLTGLFQSTGWPSVVAAMANWYGREGRGLILGVWNAHTSLGNILGSLVASAMLSYGWGWSFIVPGLGIFLGGVLIFFLLPPDPVDVGFESPHRHVKAVLDEELASATAVGASDSSSSVSSTRGKLDVSVAVDGASSAFSDGSGCCKASITPKSAESQTEGDEGGFGAVPLVVDASAAHDKRRDFGKTEMPVNAVEGDARARNAVADGNSLAEGRDAGMKEKLLGPGTRDSAAVAEVSVECTEGQNGVEVGVSDGKKEDDAIGFLAAWKIPGVAAFAFCLFFAKLVAYTVLDWLPFYISHTKINGVYVSNALAGVTSTVYDIGGVAGGILAGLLSDHFNAAHATVSAAFMTAALPSLAAYYLLGHISLTVNILLLILVGFCVNGPYALITCAVSADLGQHPSLRGNAKALSTVAGIIDGTGSLGAALGPFLTGVVADFGGGWGPVFGMLILSAGLSVACLTNLMRAEVAALRKQWMEYPKGAENEERERLRQEQDEQEKQSQVEQGQIGRTEGGGTPKVQGH